MRSDVARRFGAGVLTLMAVVMVGVMIGGCAGAPGQKAQQTVAPDSTTPAGHLGWDSVGPLAPGASTEVTATFGTVAAATPVLTVIPAGTGTELLPLTTDAIELVPAMDASLLMNAKSSIVLLELPRFSWTAESLVPSSHWGKAAASFRNVGAKTSSKYRSPTGAGDWL